MNNDVATVNQQPIILLGAFKRNFAHPCSFKFFPEMCSHGRNLSLRRARCDDHVIGKTGFTGEIDNDDILSLIVIEGRLSNFQKFLRGYFRSRF